MRIWIWIIRSKYFPWHCLYWWVSVLFLIKKFSCFFLIYFSFFSFFLYCQEYISWNWRWNFQGLLRPGLTCNLVTDICRHFHAPKPKNNKFTCCLGGALFFNWPKFTEKCHFLFESHACPGDSFAISYLAFYIISSVDH